MGSAESPFIWDSSPPAMAHLGSQPPCSASLTRDWTMAPARRRGQQGDQPDLRAVDVPLGEVGVLGSIRRSVHPTVGAGVLTVVVADHVGVEQGVVEGGVERALRGPVSRRPPGSVPGGRSRWPWPAIRPGRGTIRGPPPGRLSTASATLTKEMPTFIMTT